jgi:trk system potassium uptake protein TrkH
VLGHIILLGLVQVGGLGTMAISASLVILAGRRLRLRSAAALQDTMDLDTLGQVRGELRAIMLLTVAVEAVGALLLWIAWLARSDVEHPLAAAIFHAVSAFCTAGFSTFSDGLARFRDAPATIAVLGLLSLVGSIGFPVLAALPRA